MKTIIIDGVEYNLTPKAVFHEGDWVIYDHSVYQIVELPKEGYINLCLIRNGKIEFAPSTYCKHWTIQDAKDGDVLCYKDEILLYKHDIKNCTKQGTTFGGFVYHCCYDGKRFIVDSLYSLTEQDKMDIHPATKEQRDTLMKAMTDARYAFDFDKKELKKIIDEKQIKKNLQDNTFRRMFEQNTAWSKEDEVMIKVFDSIVRYIVEVVDKDVFERFGTRSEELFSWLKSLKHQNTWKPSDEQMDNLKQAINAFPYETDYLQELYEDLKKLREA